MYAFFGLAGIVVAIIYLVLGIVAKAKKNPKAKRNFVISLIAFIVFIGALSADSSDDKTKEASGTVSPSHSASTPSPTAVDKSKTDEDKAAAEAKKKAEAEAKEKEEEAKKKAQEQAKKPKLEVLEDSTESDGYNSYIVGVVQNNTDKDYSYVQVEINLYDKDGVQVGSTLDNTNNLEGGGKWKFKAIILDDDVASYKIKGVTGF